MFRGIGISELFVMLVLFAPYFLPTIIAILRKKTNVPAILLVNFLLGWTVVGWIVALVWAVSTERVDQVASAQAVFIPQPSRRFCPKCGKPDQVGAQFCPYCGQALS
jgi:hypothetical protein